LAAQLAYYFEFALFPALLSLVAIASFFPLRHVTLDITRSLTPFVPEEVIEIIRVVMAGRILIFSGSPAPVREAFQRVNGNRPSPMDITPATMEITPEQFTPREREVLNRLKVGKSNKIIAYELNMAESTVKVHITRIMRKISATNRTEVVYRTRHLTAIELRE